MRRKNLGRLLPPRKKKDRRLHDETDSYTDGVQTVVASGGLVPRKFGSVASGVTFADLVEPEAVDVFLKCEFAPYFLSQLKFYRLDGSLTRISFLYCKEGSISSGIVHTI
jgi:hypothetical protein